MSNDLKDRAGPPTPRGGWPEHNAAVPADTEADVCRCASCSPAPIDRLAPGSTVLLRGPVQDESKLAADLDLQVAREIEGRADDHHNNEDPHALS